MRTVGLLALVIFFPRSCTRLRPRSRPMISHDTIYPAATAESGLATTTAIDIAFSERVKASIKIISVNGAMVKSLYSSPGVTNPEKKIWDGTNTAGARVDNGTYTILISATSTVTNFAMTDSSKTVIVASSDTTPPARKRLQVVHRPNTFRFQRSVLSLAEIEQYLPALTPLYCRRV